jgi:uncharacterized repeat protein (TIGR01451 family)
MSVDTVLDIMYEVNYAASPLWSLSTENETYNLIFDSEFNYEDSLDFGFTPNIPVDSLTCNLIGAFPRCNTNILYYINYKNLGSTNPEGKLRLVLSEPLEYFSCDITPSEIIGDTIFWEYEMLDYFEEETFFVTVSMPGVEFLDYPLVSYLSASVDSLGVQVFETTDSLEQLLACAYDPNDKVVSPAGFDSLGYIFDTVEELEYTVRFQNTGTDTAFNIKIKDQLDSNLNWSSFEFLCSSHEVIVERFPTGEVIFKFNDIFLPDSGTNEPLSQGFFKYKINILDSVEAGTSIYNYAGIYFDANPPIITNTEISTLYNCETLASAISVNSGVCMTDSLRGDISFLPNESGVSWSIRGNDYLTRDFTWLPDTSGILNLELTLNTELCFIDTTILVEIYPSHHDSLIPLSICEGDSVSIFGTVASLEGFYYDTLNSIYGCDSILTQRLIVNGLPDVNFIDFEDDIICVGSGIVFLTGLPDSGTFSGPGIDGGEFDPNLAGIGVHTLHYIYEDDNGCSNTDSVQITVVDCLSIPVNDQNNMTVYPNPFSDFTTLYFGEELVEKHTIIIHNTLGQEVYRNENLTGQSLEIEKSELGVGVYFLTVLNSTELLFSTKLIVQ